MRLVAASLALLIATSAAAQPGHAPPSGIELPMQLRLNGRFDLAYERRGYSDDPGDGFNALRSYHHFLFLSREGKSDPFGVNVELVDRLFYEVTARFTVVGLRGLARIGKIFVPFGGEPLFHQAYGGRSGFDQSILPVLWTQHGATVQLAKRLWGIGLTNDLYAVQGHRLPSEDTVLDLQGHLGPVEPVSLAIGDRLGAAWGPIAAWYSIYYNDLGFGRHLLLQAIDVSLWRPFDVPVLRDLAMGVGALRADISGGGAGRDYYHFGDYATLRYFPLGWLTLQYRVGLRTTNNRRGVIFDSTRADRSDQSSHNLSVSATYRGATVTLQQFWNLEKRDERDDDLTRLLVSYEF